MAKYRVTKIYSDKETHETMHVGRDIELTDKRAKELKDYVEKSRIRPRKRKLIDRSNTA